MTASVGRRVRCSRRDDRGETSAEIVILIPLLVLLIMLGVQVATSYHAANIAQAAASSGAAAGAVRDTSKAQAAARAEQVVRENGSQLRSANAIGDARTITVTVTIDVPHIVPFFPDTVTRTASEAKERFIPEDQREK